MTFEEIAAFVASAGDVVDDFCGEEVDLILLLVQRKSVLWPPPDVSRLPEIDGAGVGTGGTLAPPGVDGA